LPKSNDCEHLAQDERAIMKWVIKVAVAVYAGGAASEENDA